MVIKVQEANLIPKEPEARLVRSLIIPVSYPQENLKGSNVSDTLKIDSGNIVKDPLIKNKNIDFSRESSLENDYSSGNDRGLINQTTSNNSPQGESPDSEYRQERTPINNFIKNKIKQVTANDPLLNNIDLKDQGTLALTSSILSAINVPEAEPLKLTLNVLTTGAKKKELKKDIEEKDIEGITTNLINVSKSYWGSIISGAKLADFVSQTSMEIGFVSVSTVANVGKVTGTVSKVANKLALPFSIVGTGLTIWDFKKEKESLTDKKLELKNFNENKGKTAAKEVIGREHQNYQERKLNKEISAKEVNLTLKGVGGCLSGISTYALISSVANPSKALMTTPVSLVTGVAGSITLALANENVREILNKKMKLLKNKYLG